MRSSGKRNKFAFTRLASLMPAPRSVNIPCEFKVQEVVSILCIGVADGIRRQAREVFSELKIAAWSEVPICVSSGKPIGLHSEATGY